MLSMKRLLEKSAKRHKHLCPRQVLGVRMGMLAAEHLEFELPQTKKRLLTIVETDGCFADGVEVATGCSIGHRTLRLQDYGKVAAVFIDTMTNHAFRIAPKLNIRQVAEGYGEGKSRWHRQLSGYQKIPIAKLCTVEWVEVNFSVKEMISRPGVRVNCAYCGEEIINEREVKVDGLVLCQPCAGFTYYRAKAAIVDMEVPVSVF